MWNWLKDKLGIKDLTTEVKTLGISLSCSDAEIVTELRTVNSALQDKIIKLRLVNEDLMIKLLAAQEDRNKLEHLIVSRADMIMDAIVGERQAPANTSDLQPINTRHRSWRQTQAQLEKLDHERYVALQKQYWEKQGGIPT